MLRSVVDGMIVRRKKKRPYAHISTTPVDSRFPFPETILSFCVDFKTCLILRKVKISNV